MLSLANVIILIQESILPNFHFSGFTIFAVKLESLLDMKKCVYCTTAKLSNEKWKNSSFTKKKNLVGLPPSRSEVNSVIRFGR